MVETKSVSALKKQLAAAIAMVLVAAVALGSSTYAWFVSNNQVTATTSTISAQSNAPFLKIANKADVADDNAWKNVTTTEDTFNETNVKTLYPAQVVGEFVAGDAEVTAGTVTAADVKFQSAYASNAYSATERDNTRFTVGKPATAVTGDYAYMESFYIGSTDAEAGSFANLNVSGVTVSVKDGATFSEYTYDSNGDGKADKTVTANEAKQQMIDAVRVLVVNNTTGDWAVWDKNGQVNSYTTTATTAPTLTGTKMVSTSNPLADTIAAGKKATIDVYVFYDGADSKIFTNNMSGLHDVSATVTFTADFVNNAAQSQN